MQDKFPLLQEQKVTDLSVVDSAAGWADALIRREHKGPGDTLDAARHRVARKHRIPERTLWALRYRRPKDLLASVFVALYRAHQIECERQEARLRHELEITKALPATPARLALIAETEALLGSLESETGRAASERTD